GCFDFAKSMDVAGVVDPSRLIKFKAIDPEKPGLHFSGSGDWNLDGLMDIILGRPRESMGDLFGSGDSLLFLSVNTEDNNVILLSETARFDALLFSGIKPYQFVGADVSTAGDFNGDGVSDIMIGGPGNLQPEG